MPVRRFNSYAPRRAARAAPRPRAFDPGVQSVMDSGASVGRDVPLPGAAYNGGTVVPPPGAPGRTDTAPGMSRPGYQTGAYGAPV